MNAITQKLIECFTQMEQKTRLLCEKLIQLPLFSAQVFELPVIEKGEENEEITTISVTPHEGHTALELGLSSFQQHFMFNNPDNASTKSARRLPGVLCFKSDLSDETEISQLVNETNHLKAELHRIITIESGLPSEQRFDFVHRPLQGLITLNAYRSFTLLFNPSSVRFGWANKNIIKNIKRDEMLNQLEKSLRAGRTVPPYTKTQWHELVNAEIELLHQLPASVKLKIKRPVKVQPIARVWYSEQQKQFQHPCPIPLIVLCSEQSPKLGQLPDYDAATIRPKHKPRSIPVRLLIERLHLYMEE